MRRSARLLVAAQGALLAAALVLPAVAGASTPTTVNLTILDGTCSLAPATIGIGDTVCARAVVTVTGTGPGEYRTHWFAPGSFGATFQDVHALGDAGTYTFEDAHVVTTAGVWSVRACRNSSCVLVSSIAATKGFTVAAAPAATTLTVGPASGTYGGTTTLTATLVTTSTVAPVVGATVTFRLPGGAGASAQTDELGVATVTDASLGTTDAGSYPDGVRATFDGSSTRAASADTASLDIARAGSTTAVTCTDGTFTGSAIEPCDASVQGVGGLDEPVGVQYSDNTDAGTAHASATFAGDANHEPSGDSTTFSIARASSSVELDCPTEVVFTGSAQEPCTASVNGAGGLAASLPVSYADNTNAGTADAWAGFGGDANHDASGDSTTFSIAPATSSVHVDCPAEVAFTGSAQQPCTASVTGAGDLGTSVDVDYTNNVLGTAGASATYGGDANHTGASGSASFRVVYAWSGFEQPLDGRGVNGFKAGQTIPVKFVLADAAGSLVRQAASPGFVRSASLGSCAAPASSDDVALSTAGSDTAFTWDGSAYHLNWSTKGLTPGLYRVSARLADGTTRSADVCLTR